MKAKILVLFIFFNTLFLFSLSLETFIEDAFLQEISLEEMLLQYEELQLDFIEDPYSLALLDYHMGRIYQAFISTDEAREYNNRMIRGRVSRLSELYSNRDLIVYYYEQALAQINRHLKGMNKKFIFCKCSNLQCGQLHFDEWVKWSILEARIVAEMCLVHGSSYMLANGFTVGKLAKRILDKDPENVRAQILLVNGKVFPAVLYGGSGRVALRLLDKIEMPKNSDNEIRFDYYIDYAYAYGRLKRYGDAKKYIDKALALYPTNVYGNFLLRLIEEEDF